MGDVFWLTGNSGAGKTTLAKGLQRYLPCIVLDGDEMRGSISMGLGLSKEDRVENNRRIATLANVLAGQGHTVVVSVIAPYDDLREKIIEWCDPHWIYLFRDVEYKDYRPYEPPKAPDLTIDNNLMSKQEALDAVLLYINSVNMLA